MTCSASKTAFSRGLSHELYTLFSFPSRFVYLSFSAFKYANSFLFNIQFLVFFSVQELNVNMIIEIWKGKHSPANGWLLTGFIYEICILPHFALVHDLYLSVTGFYMSNKLHLPTQIL